MSTNITDDVLKILQRRKIRELLRKAIEVQTEAMRKHGYKSKEEYLGFRWFEVGASPQKLNTLVTLGLLEIGYKSNKATHYRIPDVSKVLGLLEEAERLEGGEIEVGPVSVPDDLFSVIVGHDDVKEILRRSIEADRAVHVLLHGSPASAKSLFLEELARLPNSRFVLGSNLSKAGLIQVLFEQRPRFLIIDEIDKIGDEDNLSALLSLMERGIVVETKYNRQRSIRLTTTVFAAANRIEVLPPELLSRFVRLRFRDYMPDEFMEVVRVVLTEREKVPPPLAIYIGEKVLRELASRDPRDAVKVARLMSEQTKEEVDRVIEILVRRR